MKELLLPVPLQFAQSYEVSVCYIFEQWLLSLVLEFLRLYLRLLHDCYYNHLLYLFALMTGT